MSKGSYHKMTSQMLAAVAVFLAFAFVGQPGVCQEQDIFEPTTAPKLTLSDICVARIDSTEGETMVSIQVPKFRPTTKEETFSVTRHIAEVRERVRLIEGRQVTEQITVMVPVVEQVVREVTVLESDGFTVTKASLSSLVAKSLNGTTVTSEELAQQLEMPTHVFLLRSPWDEDNPPIGDYYRSVLRRDVLFVYISPEKRRPLR